MDTQAFCVVSRLRIAFYGISNFKWIYVRRKNHIAACKFIENKLRLFLVLKWKPKEHSKLEH